MAYKRAFAGFLTGTFIAMAADASAQDFSDLKFGEDVTPYEDIDITINDLTAMEDSGKYQFAYRNCAAGGQSQINLYRWPLDLVQLTVWDGYYTSQRDYEGVSQIVIGKDGTLYDMKFKPDFNKVMSGAVETGIARNSPELPKVVRKLAEGCLPKF